jgi:ATPase complex subunit ATP10
MQDNYIIFYQRMDALRRRLGITNTYLGWVFLVDAQMRVRWMAHGPALPKELADMERLTRTLHQRNVEAIAEEKAEEKADAAVKVTSP